MNSDNTMSLELKSLQKLPTHELREMCRDANMTVSGAKSQLVMRLCGMEKEKPKTRMSRKAVNKWLAKQGVVHIKTVSKCLRAGIQKGFIDISGDNPLDNIVIAGECELCEHEVEATIRDLLYQPDYAGFDYENYGEEATVKCPNEECDLIGMYVTDICCGWMRINCGKGHNHCTVCPGFGQCIGDYREEHCETCGKHFYAGAAKRFRCSCQGSDEDDYDVMFSPYF